MTQWVCPSCGNPFSSEQQPTKCPGCKFAVAAEHGPQFRELETEDLGSADGESFELVDEGDSALAAKTMDASSSSAEDFSRTVDVAATVKAEDVAEEELGTSEKTVRATLPIELQSIPLIPTVLPSTLQQEVKMRCGG